MYRHDVIFFIYPIIGLMDIRSIFSSDLVSTEAGNAKKDNVETRFFEGNPILELGQPYAIITAREVNDKVAVEIIMIFIGQDGQQPVLFHTVSSPKTSEKSLNSYIDKEIEVCRKLIFREILWKKYRAKLEELNYNADIELFSTDHNMIRIIKYKFPEALNSIKNSTTNERLKAFVERHQSINIK